MVYIEKLNEKETGLIIEIKTQYPGIALEEIISSAISWDESEDFEVNILPFKRYEKKVTIKFKTENPLDLVSYLSVNGEGAIELCKIENEKWKSKILKKIYKQLPR